jgi:hypothetical protein
MQERKRRSRELAGKLQGQARAWLRGIQLDSARARILDGPTLYLLDQTDRRLQIQTEIDEGPRDILALVLLLLEHEHEVVEVLLQLLVGEVDAELLEAVVLHAPRRRGRCNTQHRHTAKREEER